MTKAPQEMFFVIADISGYTKFMLTPGMELTHLQGIISDLLNAVLKQIEMPMAISKFEGDAVFMYAAKDGKHDWEDVKIILGRKLFAFIEAFDGKLRELAAANHCSCASCVGMGNLKLKVLAHYGSALAYEIGGHLELSGVDVIILHRLLKNQVPSSKYVLLSALAQEQLKIRGEWQKGIESYPADVGDIAVCWTILEPAQIEVKVNRWNVPDLARTARYGVMKMFGRFNSINGLKDIQPGE
ncbi:MAG: DUF2652 domain-containing protein [Burkholderiaceae bacterium]|nr:DUF2652 domain-containing protein [Burkholderiaceae bacterium]